MARQPTPNTNCPICLDMLLEPLTLSCGHSFCRHCVHSHATAQRIREHRLAKLDGREIRVVANCPLCRATITDPDSLLTQQKDIYLDHLIAIHRHPSSVARRRDEFEKQLKRDPEETEDHYADSPYRFDDERLPPAFRLFRDEAGRVHRRAPSLVLPWQVSGRAGPLQPLFCSNGLEKEQEEHLGPTLVAPTRVDWDKIEEALMRCKKSKRRGNSTTMDQESSRVARGEKMRRSCSSIQLPLLKKPKNTW